MTTILLEPEAPPVRMDGGTMRVGKSRVSINSVIYHFKQGETPERIVELFPTLTLSDTYAAIGYYLKHTEEIEQYFQEYEKEAERLRKEIEARQGTNEALVAKLEAWRLEQTPLEGL